MAVLWFKLLKDMSPGGGKDLKKEANKKLSFLTEFTTMPQSKVLNFLTMTYLNVLQYTSLYQLLK
jgi:hypothetical protein